MFLYIKTKLNFQIILLSLILLLGFSLRVYKLDQVPAGFFCDEASIGYNAYSLLTAGRDEHGNRWPLFFKAFGEYKNPVFIYSATPIVALFGLTEFSIRLTSVIYGTATILILYLFTRNLFGQTIAILSAFLLAISPWHIHFSRVGFELISSVFWITLSLYLLTQTCRNFNRYPLGIISLILAFLSYNSPKIYLPFLIAVFFITNYQTTLKWLKTKSFWLINVSAGLVLVLLIKPYLIDGSFFARWHQVKMTSINLANLSTAYFNHFSYQFLFKTGDIDFPGQFITRHSIKGMGELYLWQLPFIILGTLSYFLTKKNRTRVLFILLFLLLYPLGSIFTSINPQATRSIIGVVPFQILTGLGLAAALTFLQALFRLVSSKVSFGLAIKPNIQYPISNIISLISMITMISLMTASTLNFSRLYFHDYPKYSSDYWGWQYGYRPIMDYFKQQQSNFNQLLITHRFNRGEMLLKFYNVTYQCHKCQVMTNPISIDLSQKQLFALRDEDIAEAEKLYPNLHFTIEKIIYLPNGQPEIFIGKFSFPELSLSLNR